MKKMTIIITICISVFITSCATKPSELTATYVAPSIYSSWDCDQINTEITRTSGRVATLTGQQNKLYSDDQMKGWVGTFLLWPILLFIKGDGSVAAELQSAKGTLDALQTASVEKKCAA